MLMVPWENRYLQGPKGSYPSPVSNGPPSINTYQTTKHEFENVHSRVCSHK